MFCVSPADRLCSVLLCGAHPTSNAGTTPDALPAAGPYGCGPSARDRQLAQLRTTKAALEAELSEYVKPDDAVDAGAHLGDLLTAATHKWYSDFGAAHFNIDEVDKPQDRWIDILCRLPQEFESWTARVFILYGAGTSCRVSLI